MSQVPPPTPQSPDPPSHAGPDELRQLRRKLRLAERELERREAELALLRGSHSFKLTAPLRWLRRRLSRSSTQGLIVDRLLSPEGRLPPAIAAFPNRMVRRAPPDKLNDSHRPLVLDDAIQPLVPLQVVEGALRESVRPYKSRYYGGQQKPPRVATVAESELRQELSFDVAVLPLHADRWAEQLRSEPVEMLLLDGAWEPEGGWGAGFGGSPASQKRMEPLLEHCRRHRIPVVLWAREDAGQLERLQWLIPRATRVYAVDKAGEQWMRARFRDLDFGLLPVAVQPALYNPIRSYRMKDCRTALAGTVLLDGWWALSSHSGSHSFLETLGQRLRVVETDGDYSWARLQDIGFYASSALGSVTALEKSALLKGGAAELFTEHAATSSWRRATHMLRAAASGSVLLVNGTQTPPPMRSMEIPPGSVNNCLEGLKAPMPDISRAVHTVLRDILAKHCVADRLKVMFQELGVDHQLTDAPMRVAHLLVTMRPELLEQCLARFRADQYENKELVVVLHSDGASMAAARALIREGEPIKILQASTVRSLGDCLNMAIAHTDAPFWMKLDDDDFYGRAYTQDMMLYRRAIKTPLMGKPPAFLHLERSDEVRWDSEWASHANLLHDPDEASAALVAGGTLAGTREILETEGFSGARRGGSDSEFIERCLGAGHRLLATDAFNFARYRQGTSGFHTWKVSDEELKQRTVLLGGGEALQRQVSV